MVMKSQIFIQNTQHFYCYVVNLSNERKPDSGNPQNREK